MVTVVPFPCTPRHALYDFPSPMLRVPAISISAGGWERDRPADLYSIFKTHVKMCPLPHIHTIPVLFSINVTYIFARIKYNKKPDTTRYVYICNLYISTGLVEKRVYGIWSQSVHFRPGKKTKQNVYSWVYRLLWSRLGKMLSVKQ